MSDSYTLTKAERMKIREYQVHNRLDNDQSALEKCVLFLYSKQTPQEKIVERTLEHNGVGFSAVDDKLFTYCAKWIVSGKHLTGKFLVRIRKSIKKYTRQLINMGAFKW
jgi:hypothetical protein